MKKTKFIIIAAILVAFVMTLNAFGQNGSKGKSRSNKNARSTKTKGPKTTNYSFGANQTNGDWNKRKNQRKQIYSGPFGLPDIMVSSRKKPRKPKNAKVQFTDLSIMTGRRKPRKH